jgi:hypothetical protein
MFQEFKYQDQLQTNTITEKTASTLIEAIPIDTVAFNCVSGLTVLENYMTSLAPTNKAAMTTSP